MSSDLKCILNKCMLLCIPGEISILVPHTSINQVVTQCIYNMCVPRITMQVIVIDIEKHIMHHSCAVWFVIYCALTLF